MTVETWISYVVTVLVLMSTPGPSHMLMLSNSMVHGVRRSFATALGDLSANACQIAAVSLGLAGMVRASAAALFWVKWGGVAYLVHVGLRLIRTSATGPTNPVQAGSSRTSLFMQGFTTSASNPKAILFFAALFPQFIHYTSDPAPQFLVLGITYIVVDGIFLSFYGLSAGYLAGKLTRGLRARTGLFSGGMIIVAAVLLALKGG